MAKNSCLTRWSITIVALACASWLAPGAMSQERSSGKDNPPVSVELSGEDKTRVEELDRRITDLRGQGKYAEAIPLAEETAALRARVQGQEHWEAVDARRVVDTLRQIAALPDEAQAELSATVKLASQSDDLYKQGKFAGAEPLDRKILQTQIRHLGSTHPETLTSMNNLGILLKAQGKFSEAESLYRKALDGRRHAVGTEHRDTLNSMNNLSMLLLRQGKLREAEELARRTLEVQRRVLGDEHSETRTSMNNLASVLSDQGKLSEAEALFRRVLSMQRRILGQDHPHVLMSMGNLASLLKDQGRLSEAEPLLRFVAARFRQVAGDSHPNTFEATNQLAQLLADQGKLAKAEPLFRRTLLARREILGDRHPSTLASTNNLASLLCDQGSLAEAEELFRLALEGRRSVFGDEHNLTLQSMNNLAYLLARQDRFLEARRLHTQVLEARRRLYGNEHADTLLAMNNLAVVFYREGNFPEARKLAREASSAARRTLGTNHPISLAATQNLGHILHEDGMFSDAEIVLQSAEESFGLLRLQTSASGLERALFATERSPLPLFAGILARAGKARLAWRRLESSLARGLLDTFSTRHGRPLSTIERNREGELLGQLTALDERTRALPAAEHSTSDMREILVGLGQQRDALEAELAQFQAQIQEKYGVQAGKLYELPRIQRHLGHDSGLLAWIDIKGSPHAVDPNGEHWACLVRREGEPIWVKLPGTGENGAWTEEDDALPKRVREALGQRSDVGSPELRELLERLRAQRIAPAEEHLSGIGHLVVLPAGWMAGVPVEALTDDYTITYAPSGTMYAWLREKSDEAMKGRSGEGMGRLLALGDPVFRQPDMPTTPAPEPPEHGVLLAMVVPDSNAARSGLKGGDVLLTYGDKRLSGPEDLGPAIQQATEGTTTRGEAGIPIKVWRGGETLDFRMAAGKMGVRPSQQPVPEAILTKRQLDEALAATRGATFAPLPGTRREVQAIARLAETAGKQEEAVMLLGPNATEQRLDALATSGEMKKFRFLHFATHGVMDDQMAMRSALILSQDSTTSGREAYERVLAGEEVYDGRLTAEQIVRTWKLDADLVTLSACESALGKQAGGEGFLGFSQALFVAGARNMVLSLWKVDDVSTSILMEEFYRNLLVRKMPLAEALRKAKVALRTMTRAEVDQHLKTMGITDWSGSVRSRAGEAEALKPTDKPFEDPYYWAPFILVGAG